MQSVQYYNVKLSNLMRVHTGGTCMCVCVHDTISLYVPYSHWESLFVIKSSYRILNKQ